MLEVLQTLKKMGNTACHNRIRLIRKLCSEPSVLSLNMVENNQILDIF